MIVIFTEKEKEWLIRDNLNIYIKSGCPENIQKSLQKKIDLLNKQADDDLERKAMRQR